MVACDDVAFLAPGEFICASVEGAVCCACDSLDSVSVEGAVSCAGDSFDQAWNMLCEETSTW